jgi:hypothetical protein
MKVKDLKKYISRLGVAKKKVEKKLISLGGLSLLRLSLNK